MMLKAKESRQVQKARRKLQHQIQEEHKLVTANALNKVSEEIKTWIYRHAKDRVKLKDKDIRMFDENQHSEKTHSRYVQHLLDQLSHSPSTSVENNLSGRVLATEESFIENEFDEEQ